MNASLRVLLPVVVWIAVCLPGLTKDLAGASIRVPVGDRIVMAGNASATGAAPVIDNPATVLFNSRTRKYHEHGCRRATGKGLQEMPRSDAENQGSPCKACHPASQRAMLPQALPMLAVAAS